MLVLGDTPNGQLLRLGGTKDKKDGGGCEGGDAHGGIPCDFELGAFEFGSRSA